LRVDVPAAEALCGWTFVDELAAVVALHPHLPGFSRLEFLGDAMLNLSVFSAVTLEGVERGAAARAVANASLDARIDRSPLASSRRSGDVLEALIGAVHLEGGLRASWAASLRIAAAAAGVSDDLVAPPVPDAVVLDLRAGAFVGSALLAAVVADRLCRTEPEWTHDRYSDGRSSLLGTARLARLARRHLPDRTTDRADATCADELQAAAAQRFLDEGWDGGVAAATGFGVLTP